MNPEKRLTATQVRDNIKTIIDSYASVQDVDRLVPELGASDDLLSSHSSFRAMVILYTFYGNLLASSLNLSLSPFLNITEIIPS